MKVNNRLACGNETYYPARARMIRAPGRLVCMPREDTTRVGLGFQTTNHNELLALPVVTQGPSRLPSQAWREASDSHHMALIEAEKHRIQVSWGVGVNRDDALSIIELTLLD